MLRKILREPLLHFLFIGLLLFVLFGVISGRQGGSAERIVISQALVGEIAEAFQATWQRPPSAEELQGLVDSRVREELVYREGMALGLDRDDPVIRRRVVQKLEVMAEESALLEEVEDAELEAYLQGNAQRYAQPAAVAFEQVLFDPDKHGEQLQVDLEAGLTQLQAGEAADEVGDRTQLPGTLANTPLDLIARDFGEPFALELPELPAGRWVGPVASGFGLHLVRVNSLTPARPSMLAEVRRAVERDWENDRRMQSKQAYYDQLREKYPVIIETEALPTEAQQ